MPGRFGYDIRDANNKLVKCVGGFETREDVEAAVRRKEEEIQRRGGNMRVYITENYKIDGKP